MSDHDFDGFESDDSLNLDELDKQVDEAKKDGQNVSNTDRPTHHELNHEESKTWIYPTNFPIRNYQYTIVEQSLFKNVLCALPTGLGKTFIASTVMLNWYRWTKTAKIIFMAPTRPLVSQQVDACLGITGIPKRDVSVLIGGVMSPKQRAIEWKNKRVFFATPQTVENDIKKGVIHPNEIVLMVIDEAHRATGRYAYTEVITFVSKFNKSFRILALTATPSTTVEGVQAIFTNLKISKAEIRTEESTDIKPHVHKRDIQRFSCDPLPIQDDVMEKFIEAMNPLIKEMYQYKALYNPNPENLNQFAVLTDMLRFFDSPEGNKLKQFQKFRVTATMVLLISLGGAMTLLKIHGVRQFYDKIIAIREKFLDAQEVKKKNKTAIKFFENENIHEMLKTCENVLKPNGKIDKTFLGHGKLQRLVEEMNDFFAAQTNEDSRAIVFVEFRGSAAEVCRALANNCEKAKPHLFIGQQGESVKKQKEQEKVLEEAEGEENQDDLEFAVTDEISKTAKRGMKQKEQQRVVKEFKEGNYNILVATSVGEEGLDIGQVDLIVCYDQSKSPIRVLQRLGRTGRKRAGKIIMLMAKNEERKLDHAMGGYKYIQELITNGEKGEFEYEKEDRILPKEFKPDVDKRRIEIPNENESVLDKHERSAASLLEELQQQSQECDVRKLPAVKRRWFMPEGVQTGFVKASDMNTPIGGSSGGGVSEMQQKDENDSQFANNNIIEDLISDEDNPSMVNADINSRVEQSTAKNKFIPQKTPLLQHKKSTKQREQKNQGPLSHHVTNIDSHLLDRSGSESSSNLKQHVLSSLLSSPQSKRIKLVAPPTVNGYLTTHQQLELKRKYPQKVDLRYYGVKFTRLDNSNNNDNDKGSMAKLVSHSSVTKRFLQFSTDGAKLGLMQKRHISNSNLEENSSSSIKKQRI